MKGNETLFSRRVVERWNNLEQHVVNALNIISFKNKLKQIRKTRMGFMDPR